MRVSPLAFSALLLLGACTAKPPLRVLTYSSLTGKDSLGASIKESYEKKCRALAEKLNCELVFVPEDGESNLVATYLKNPKNYDALLGLEGLQVEQLRQKSPILRADLFARGPHAFIVDTEQWKDPALWPKKWADLKKFPSSVFLQDPRVSSVGLGWIKAIFMHQLIDLDVARKITRKVFPSWSLSYDAFQKKGAPLVWSYQSSEAYHRCEEKSTRYRVLPLAEGYPVQREYFVVPLAEPLPAEKDLLAEVLLSEEIQTQIPKKNWMWPASDTTAVPDCFREVTPLKALEDAELAGAALHLQRWLDQWSL
jgi:thiamine transport system substrate-binding protein